MLSLALQLLRELKKTNFTFDNQFWSFDEYGDFVSGYDLVKWEISGLTRKFQKIGSYSVRDEQVKIDVKDVTWFSTTNTTVRSLTHRTRYTQVLLLAQTAQLLYNRTNEFLELKVMRNWSLSDLFPSPLGPDALRAVPPAL